MASLIIAEKPSVALRIALSLGDGQPRRVSINGVAYFELSHEGKTAYVAAAAGHLFTVRQRGTNAKLPIFDVEWIESYKSDQKAYYTKKYLDTIKMISVKCDSFINACDYDIEGTVIGTNIIKYIIGGDVNKELADPRVKRMRFSTTTRADLLESFAHLDQFDHGNFDAGETRHMLDWMWGMNFSRALMRAIATTGQRRVMSIGRVQGPTLAILAQREIEIKAFVPKPFWKVLLSAKGVQFENRRGNIFEKPTAEEAFKKTKAANVAVEKVDHSELKVRPYPPFDLTSLQLEANRTFRMDPTRTLAIAQSLYEKAYISYPRTSSQKLPATLNLPRIMNELAKNDTYKALAEKLIKESRFRPNEGAKTDEAHPAIYPTGELAKKLTEEEEKIYDLIAKRFLACFADYATKATVSVVLDAAGEKYAASGSRVVSAGWTEFYKPYYKQEDVLMPEFKPAEQVAPSKVDMKELKTEPPRRYTKASLISTLEKKNLGTKATRTGIIDTLFRREYIKDSSIVVTDFGMSVYNALSKYCARILDEELTRKLEADMEGIIVGKTTKMHVIGEGKNIITEIMSSFEKSEKEIGQELGKGLAMNAQANVLGKCNKCGAGGLVIKRSKLGKQFVGCSNWPNCNNAFPLPQAAKIVPTGKVCEFCKTPFVKVFRRGKKPFEMDLDPTCVTKKDWAKPKEEARPVTAAKLLEESKKAEAPKEPEKPVAVVEPVAAAKPTATKKKAAAKAPAAKRPKKAKAKKAK